MRQSVSNDKFTKHGRKTEQDKSLFSTKNGLLLSHHVLCLQQRNNPINEKTIKANPEALCAL